LGGYSYGAQSILFLPSLDEIHTFRKSAFSAIARPTPAKTQKFREIGSIAGSRFESALLGGKELGKKKLQVETFLKSIRRFYVALRS
jgi:hypothetical protein